VLAVWKSVTKEQKISAMVAPRAVGLFLAKQLGVEAKVILQAEEKAQSR